VGNRKQFKRTAKRQYSRSKLAVFETMDVGDDNDDAKIGEDNYLVRSLAICRDRQSLRYVLEKIPTHSWRKLIRISI
jgi:hypothetical protein